MLEIAGQKSFVLSDMFLGPNGRRPDVVVHILCSYTARREYAREKYTYLIDKWSLSHALPECPGPGKWETLQLMKNTYW